MSSASEGAVPRQLVAASWRDWGVRRLRTLPALLDARVATVPPLGAPPREAQAVIGWGQRASGRRAAALAQRHGLACWRLEDGFLRSVGLGHDEPPLSLLVDDQGIYYDAASPSRLEALIAAPHTAAALDRARALQVRWREARLSKYNHARETGAPAREGPYARFARCPHGPARATSWSGGLSVASGGRAPLTGHVLVVDQTFGDASIAGGLADAASFTRMLEAALDEHATAPIVLKVHPDVVAGRKRGHFERLTPGEAARITLLAADVHVPALLEHAAAVYTVTSQVGFEALLWRRPVRCFGMPFYAGWGLTHDALPAPARRGLASLDALVDAALVQYARYLDPETQRRCEVERLIDHLELQRRMRARFAPQVLVIGFSRWKEPIARAFLGGSEVIFARAASQVPAGATVAVWGRRALPVDAAMPDAPRADAPRADAPRADAPRADAPRADAPRADTPHADTPHADTPHADTPHADAPHADAPHADAPHADAPHADAPHADARHADASRADAARTTPLRIEDGFIRSVGLGADLTRPLSWVQDDLGIYFDATRPSRLEVLLQDSAFTPELTQRARRLRESIVAAGITKYNVGAADWTPPQNGKPLVLVPGQVETDASIAFGAAEIRSNLELLRAARAARPGAHVIYKPHPDVLAGLRGSRQESRRVLDACRAHCDEIITDAPMGRLLDAVDEVHALTSLAGFEALLRGKAVVTWGLPFYAGWGLTDDRAPPSSPALRRRTRRLALDELVAATLILYPAYVSRSSGAFTTPERALQELVAWRRSAVPDSAASRWRALERLPLILAARWRALRP